MNKKLIVIFDEIREVTYLFDETCTYISEPSLQHMDWSSELTHVFKHFGIIIEEKNIEDMNLSDSDIDNWDDIIPILQKKLKVLVLKNNMNEAFGLKT